jgi:protein phosphatase-4 regulatory subunit 3
MQAISESPRESPLTAVMFNDNGILEYILQDGIFLGVIGMLEYDPEFPSLKASFRQFFTEISKFRQVVEIRDVNIRTKIHQTYRLQYLKEVVLARLLDDPTFGILNGFIFFNQVDIIAYFQAQPSLVYEILSVFKGPALVDTANEEKQKDTVAFLHQLMLIGKTTQVPTRLQLYRNLLSKGLGCALAWALRRSEAAILHAGAEMLTLMAEHDANAVRADVLDDLSKGTRSLVTEMIEVMGTTKNLGLLSQISDTFKTLLETPAESEVGGVRVPADNSHLHRNQIAGRTKSSSRIYMSSVSSRCSSRYSSYRMSEVSNVKIRVADDRLCRSAEICLARASS